MDNEQSLRPVDHAALGTNQALIIGLLIVAFVVNAAWVALAVGLVMAVGTAIGKPGFWLVYRGLRRLKVVKPLVLQDNNEPHRFSQGLGAGFVLAGAGLLLAGVNVVGWALVWLVVALAALNLFGGFCVGCFVYYWLGRLKLPGFSKAPPPNTLPGTRPAGVAK